MAKFKTRARAVDMLGRQQIADAATAISELFKNAHDAYAENVEVDLFCSDSLLAIRDDGYGMTPDEFEANWLVLGTDTKLKTQSNHQNHSGVRVVMGEKGIGRLAIAFLGPQVLVMTRSNQEQFSHTLTMCYVHWGLFEKAGLNLEDIEIPIRHIANNIPTAFEVIELLQENLRHIENLQSRFPDVKLESIVQDVNDFQLDPDDFLRHVGGPTLADARSGTHFYVAPIHDSILSDIRIERTSERKEFSKCLLGFCNLAFCKGTPPSIATAFRFWEKNALQPEDLIGPKEFFTQDDLRIADQYISGAIDAYGQFRGTVRVYEQEFDEHIISWRQGEGQPTECGPFTIEFGYLQGTQRESKAAPEDFARLNSKLNQIGGLYVYRDGIRILPYGNSDVDWLNIEERRNRGMGHYFFSYRRIYGAVCLTRNDNFRLKEKAGREGFQKDKAYKHLKSVLENLFVQLAADFFRKDALLGDYFQERKSELDRLERARRKQEQRSGIKRTRFSDELASFFSRTHDTVPESEISALRAEVSSRMHRAMALDDPDEASRELLEAELAATRKLAELRTAYRVSKPRGVGLTKQLARDWEAYQSEHARLETTLFGPFATEVAENLGSLAAQARVYIDQRRRLQELINGVAQEKNATVRTEANLLQDATNEARRAAINTARTAIRELRRAIEEVNEDLAHRDLSDAGPSELQHIRQSYEERIGQVAARHSETLGSIRELLSNLAASMNEPNAIVELDVTEALEAELQSLREDADADAELVQLGLAVAVINHEFVASIKMIRQQLRELRSWAKVNEDLLPLYTQIRTNFDHLDAHLNLFTPLQRRLYRERVPVQGKQLAHYVTSLFDVRFKRHGIELDATDAFLAASIVTYPSSIYPVFVNLIDNFVFWLRDHTGHKVITLDAKDGALFVCNSGPSIHARDADAIFEQGFSRKPGGRGLGLFISRRVLEREGMKLSLLPSAREGSSVCFQIDTAKVDV